MLKIDRQGNLSLLDDSNLTSYYGRVSSASTHVKRLDPYVSAIVEMAEDALRASPEIAIGGLAPDVLNGQAAAKLRDIVPLKARRQTGAFFSSSELRASALAPWNHDVGIEGPIVDPAIGGGDLLLEAAKYLPVERDLALTLRQWNTILFGRDIEQRFVSLAKARLVLLAVSLGATHNSHSYTGLHEVLSEIRVGDGLSLLRDGWSGGHIIMNPPYIYEEASEDVSWTNGRTNLAALFIDSAVQAAEPGTRVTAILPDVIRTGTRYEKLRSLLDEQLDSLSIQPYGRFDSWTDIDVFVLRGIVRAARTGTRPAKWWRESDGRRVSDLFNISVGPVVPHRQSEPDEQKPFLHAKAIPLGGYFDLKDADRRGYRNRLVQPPFVAIRRTSRPGDRSRGTGTIIFGTEGALVENHLVTLSPKDSSVDTCRQLVTVLESEQTREWLDERIRCRHLTVKALSDMPWSHS